MRLLQGASSARAVFDDPNLVSSAGLVPVMELAESCDLHGVVGEHVRIPGDKGANASGKVATIVAGILTGADSIDDLDVVRHGGMPSLFGGVYAPSTLGEFLRAFTHGHVRQLQAASREFLVGLAGRTRCCLARGRSRSSTGTRCCGGCTASRSRAPGFGHAKVGGYQVLLRGLNPLIATISTPDAAPVIAATQLRAGNAGSARGAASLLAEAIATTKAVLAAQATPAAAEIVVRADSAFYAKKLIAACRRAGVRFSVTIRVDKKVRRAIAAIPDDAWVEIEYPQPVWDDEQQRFITRAQIAEIGYTAFEGTRWAVTARLIVRRVPDLNRTSGDGQGELFAVWRYHAAFTDSPFVLVQAEAPAPRPRRHRTGLRRTHRRPSGAPALGQVRRQQRLAGLYRDRAQPDPRRGHPRRTRLRHRPLSHHPTTPDQRSGAHRPPRPSPHPAPTRTLARAISLATTLDRCTPTTSLTIVHIRHFGGRRGQPTSNPRSTPSFPAQRPGTALRPNAPAKITRVSDDHIDFRPWIRAKAVRPP